MVFTEAVDGGGAIATLDIASGRTEMLWTGGQNAAPERQLPQPRAGERWQDERGDPKLMGTQPGGLGGSRRRWEQLTHANADQRPHWGKAESVIWTERRVSGTGMAAVSGEFRPGEALSDGGAHPWRPGRIEIRAWPTRISTCR